MAGPQVPRFYLRQRSPLCPAFCACLTHQKTREMCFVHHPFLRKKPILFWYFFSKSRKRRLLVLGGAPFSRGVSCGPEIKSHLVKGPCPFHGLSLRQLFCLRTHRLSKRALPFCQPIIAQMARKKGAQPQCLLMRGRPLWALELCIVALASFRSKSYVWWRAGKCLPEWAASCAAGKARCRT